MCARVLMAIGEVDTKLIMMANDVSSVISMMPIHVRAGGACAIYGLGGRFLEEPLTFAAI
jgi:hypothetical protein